jgi:acyl carrier protein
VPTLSRDDAGPAALDTVLAQVLVAGGPVETGALFPRRGAVVTLPAYPWQRGSHWSGDPGWWDTAPGSVPIPEAPEPAPMPPPIADPRADMESVIAELLARTLLSTPDQIDLDRPLGQLGMDSLMGSEFTVLFRERVGCELTVTELLSAPSATALAERALSRMP